MSWGERSCKGPCRMAIGECNPGTCNVDCPGYIYDGMTLPDSKPQKKAEGTIPGKDYMDENRAKLKMFLKKY